MDTRSQDPTDEMVEIERQATEDEARERAATLVAQGIGAEVNHPVDPASGPPFVIQVLPGDAIRARRVLGLDETPDGPFEAEDLTRAARPWLVPTLVMAAVYVIVPLVAFYLTFKLRGG